MRLRVFALLLAAALAPRARAGDPLPPAPPPAAGVQLDKDRLMFDLIQDDAPLRGEAENQSEFDAYNAVLLHARQFPQPALAAAARRDVLLKDLFNEVRRDYRLELVHFDGRLKLLRRVEPTKPLRDAGVKDVYEGWMFPRGSNVPVCVVMTELPVGLDAQKDLQSGPMDRDVGFAGYSFKLIRYETREANPKNPSRNVVARAPMLLGRSATVAPVEAGNPWFDQFLPGVVAACGLTAAAVLGLAWYFRRTDRAVRAAVAARQERNPFQTS